MSKSEEIKELKKHVSDSFKEVFAELPTEDLPEPVAQVKEDIETRIAAETIGIQFLEELKDVVVSRNKLKEAEADIASSLSIVQELVSTMSAKIDALGELKRENLALEREVLNKIKTELKKEG